MFYASCLSPQKNHLFTHHKNAPCNWLSAHKTRGRARRMCSWPRHGIFKCKFNGHSLSGWHLMALLVDSKISPTYPWKIPRMFHQQCMFRNFFLCGVKGEVFAVSSQGPCGQNHWIFRILQALTAGRDILLFEHQYAPENLTFWTPKNWCFGNVSGPCSKGSIFRFQMLLVFGVCLWFR